MAGSVEDQVLVPWPRSSCSVLFGMVMLGGWGWCWSRGGAGAGQGGWRRESISFAPLILWCCQESYCLEWVLMGKKWERRLNQLAFIIFLLSF